MFVPPEGIDVEWDFKNYNRYEKTIIARFSVSLAHQNPNHRKSIEQLDKYIESLGRYVITDNALHRGFNNIEFGQKTTTYMDHPYLKAVPKEIDVKLSEKEHELSKIIDLDELREINRTIIGNAYRDRNLKPFRDMRFKPRDVGKGYKKEYEVYTALLESVD